MRSELLLIEKIEHYLEGTLSPKETALFESQLKADTALQQEVELQRQIMGGIQRTVTRKKVAAAFIKYKTIAILTKLGIIVFSAGVVTTTAVVVYKQINPSEQTPKQNPVQQEQVIIPKQVEKDTVVTYSEDTLVQENGNEEALVMAEKKEAKLSEVSPSNDNKKSVFLNNSKQNNETAEEEKEELPVEEINPAAKASVKSLSVKEKQQLLRKFFFDIKAPITWLGIDFSAMRILEKAKGQKGDEEEPAEKISNHYFKEWNDLVPAEKKRYDIAGALRHDKVDYDYSFVQSKNDTINVNRLFVSDKSRLKHLNEDAVRNIVAGYPIKNPKAKGYGLVFVVESFDGQKKETNNWVTLVDMKTGQVLITERMYANIGGVGLRNYWARGFHNTINDVKERKYPEWKSKYFK